MISISNLTILCRADNSPDLCVIYLMAFSFQSRELSARELANCEYANRWIDSINTHLLFCPGENSKNTIFARANSKMTSRKIHTESILDHNIWRILDQSHG